MNHKSRLEKISDVQWHLEPTGKMRVPVVVYADGELLREMDDKALEQAVNVAGLPGIVKASFCMPDAHWGYGFPIGGVAAFDPSQGGVVSAGGVGFDISCGVRTLLTGLTERDVRPRLEELADGLFRAVPAGVGSTGKINLDDRRMKDMLEGGARWAVEQGWGDPADLRRTEEGGCIEGADPGAVSVRARERQRREMGTLGAGNHYLELQLVEQVFDGEIARGFGLEKGQLVVSMHCGSRGLGHQIGTDYLKEMLRAAPAHGIDLPDKELACVPIQSKVGKAYLGAMRAGINCALANRQILTCLVRGVFQQVFGPDAGNNGPWPAMLYDVSHNTCKVERHQVQGRLRELHVHRKGGTRAFGPGHPELPGEVRPFGQPVLIGGSMGTCSYILAGTTASEDEAFSSACHGAGRVMSRNQAKKQWKGRDVMEKLARQGILIRAAGFKGIAEEAPQAYKDVTRVVETAHRAGLARLVARLVPIACVKG